MKIEIRRLWETSRSVCGEMWIDGKLECFTLEPARTTPVHAGHPCIAAGTYRVVLSLSPHLDYVCPEVLDVPGRSAIRWHIGNKPEDVLGCIAVGEQRSTDWVANSRSAFQKLMTVLGPAARTPDGITAVYLDPPSFVPIDPEISV
jgi:hypothetical protein